MAYTYAEEIIGLKEEIKKHGGTKIDLDTIADEYNPERLTPYPVGDLVIYNGDLYKATAAVTPKAGAFKPEMWDEIAEYDETVAYSLGSLVVYQGTLYRNVNFEATEPQPEEWNPEHWTQHTANSYDVNTMYYNGSVVEYDTNYYRANSNYANDPVGDFNLLYWTPTSVEQLISKVIERVSILLYNLTTDENGYLDMSSIAAANTGKLTGKTIISIVSNPYGGMAPAGTTGMLLTRINQNYFLLEDVVAGERTPVKSTTLGGQYQFNFYCI